MSSRSSYDRYRGERRQDSFTASTHKLIHYCSSDKNGVYSLNKLCTKLGFHQRRFYDVINVLNTVGFCTKRDSTKLQWNGHSNVKSTISKMVDTYHIFDESTSLESILPSDGTISISKVTETFLMLFLFLGIQYIDIKEASIFLSVQSGRQKTTLCKLYQIAQILEVAGIVSRTNQTSEIKINDQYFVKNSFTPKEVNDPLNLDQLLNRPVENLPHDQFHIRRSIFKNLIQNDNSKESEVTI
ncbi:hypothetical protein TVAG_165210 [Trichomonas vaginalis G3]|uniref:E2F/DP family winged-helix DNA-binding domain-containing protein n=1 Tax=Trichomonas vaginalis (strain ATCC PRA-98 / G3) TaxID=412133 RepID=A2DUK2_TRIV3|nr:transcription factor, enhancer of yellow 2 family [Trichomonas vaginalis G3]EAY15893.1 hypothetical protein TVAG_165210 [Trichomonas vaginalis G3]KAI5506646.1 transcription factor, enhancer of yellow 2 family [Trichomonas vaginalis G3]|eukprot:XP_001328116.1 hypothetical protein [Trichomonas vaginalis G3]